MSRRSARREIRRGQGADVPRDGSQEGVAGNEQRPEIPAFAVVGDYLPICPVPPDGLEPSTL